VNIPGATNSAFTANNVQLSDSGSVFTCVVSNAYGATPSSNAVLTVYLPPLLQNGGFELGNFNGWTQSGNAWGESVIGTAPFVHSGGYGAKLGPTGTLGYLSQNVATSIGQSYLISCWLNSDGLTPNEFLISWNGATLFDGVNLAATGWTNLQFLAAATATNTVLELGFRDDPGYLGLDDLSVVPASLSISGTHWSGANLVLNGSNGVSGETNYVLTSTNLALPLSQWTPVATNLLGATGNFTVTVTNAATPGNRQQFYILRLQ
jgi:hypothetical protein